MSPDDQPRLRATSVVREARFPGAPDLRSDVKIVDLGVEQGAGHDDALDLVGAFIDLGDLSPGTADVAIYREYSRRAMEIHLGSSRRFSLLPDV